MCGRYIYNHCPQQCVPKYMCVHVCVYCSITIKFPCHGEYNIPFSTKYISLTCSLYYRYICTCINLVQQ